MKVTYIHHSSFLVELEKVLLLFDYFQGNIPELDPEKDLLVFASHRHGDHFSPVIFDLVKRHPRTLFVLSDDIWQNKVPVELYGKAVFVDPGKVLELPEGGGTRIAAYKSTDEGVAFVVENGGKTVYHAGDLNDWRWMGEDKAWNNNMTAMYRQELGRMREDGVHPDVAMVVLDSRQEDWFHYGFHEFMEQIGAEHVFPMHFWGDYGIAGRLKAMECSEGYREKVLEIREEGQVFEV